MRHLSFECSDCKLYVRHCDEYLPCSNIWVLSGIINCTNKWICSKQFGVIVCYAQASRGNCTMQTTKILTTYAYHCHQWGTMCSLSADVKLYHPTGAFKNSITMFHRVLKSFSGNGLLSGTLQNWKVGLYAKTNVAFCMMVLLPPAICLEC